MTRIGKRATEEQRAAAEHLGSLDDSLARWVRSAGPIDAYETHLPVEVRGPLEWFAFAVISRQLSRASAVAIHHRLVKHLGGSVTGERVVSAGAQALRDVGLSHQKAETLLVLARHDGLLDPGVLATMTDTEVRAEVEALPGLGPSSAQRFLLHYLHRPDVFLAHDFTVRQAITALDRLDHTITPKAAERRSESWRPYRSYATSYLWGYAWEHYPVVSGNSG